MPTIEQVDGSWNSGKLKLTKTDVVWGKLNINAVGDIIFDSAVKPIETPKSKPAATATNATEKAVTKKESGPSKYDVYIEKIENVVTDLNKTIKINEPVNVDLNFELNGPIKERSFVVAKIDTKNVSYKDFNASNADLYFTWSPNSLNLHSLRIDQNDRYFSATAKVNMSDYTFIASAENTLLIDNILNAVDPKIADMISQQKVGINEKITISLKATDKDWIKNRSISGTIETPSILINKLQLNNIDIDFENQSENLTISKLQTDILGDTKNEIELNGGKIDANGALNTKTKDYKISTTFDFNPALLLKLYTNDILESVAKQHVFLEPAKFSINSQGNINQADSHIATGRIEAGKFSRNGFAISSGYCDFEYKKWVINLSKIHGEKDGKTGDGYLWVDIKNKKLGFEMKSNANPNFIAGMVHELVAYPINFFEFNGESNVDCKGELDFGKWIENKISGTYNGTNIVSPAGEGKTVKFDFGLNGLNLFFTNVVTEMHGGMVTGDVNLLLGMENDPKPYSTNISIKDISVNKLAEFFGQLKAGDQLGILNGNCVFKGDLDKPWESSLTGNGHAQISNGWLFELPVLSSLTTIARTVFTSFNVFSQTDCGLDFTFSDSTIHTDNFLLEGDLMSLAGYGKYNLFTGFDANAEILPFRKNIFTRLVQWASTPISELMKFHVEGTLSNPNWRLSYIPKISIKKSGSNE